MTKYGADNPDAEVNPVTDLGTGMLKHKRQKIDEHKGRRYSEQQSFNSSISSLMGPRPTNFVNRQVNSGAQSEHNYLVV